MSANHVTLNKTWLLTAALVFAAIGFAVAHELEDKDISSAVQKKLLFEDAVPSQYVDVSTRNGIVTLSGFVDTYDAKWEAESAARSTKGVSAVINKIETRPLVRTDAQIRADVMAALALDPVTESYEISVQVEGGIVTLTGTVDSYSEKTVARRVAEATKGVIGVQDLLVYDFDDSRSDVDVLADVRYRLQADASIDAALITVSVKEGEVTLDGSVGSAEEKAEAESEARIVPGVRLVANLIDVQWWRRPETEDWNADWSDAKMKLAIEHALLTNPRVKSFQIRVMVVDGVASLTGIVDNLQAKRTAEQETLNVLGIQRVNNALRVKPSENQPNQVIAEAIRDAFHRNPYVDRYDVSVAVDDGLASLSGNVDSWYIRERAEEVAAGIPGVVDVENNLTVNSVPSTRSDLEIKQDIEGFLWWSPFLDSSDIQVKVQTGVATLEGRVNDWQEAEIAKNNALHAGAKSVVDQLEVRNSQASE